MTYRVIPLMYGDKMEVGLGYYDHPEGGSCALMVFDIVEFEDADEAIEFGIEMEAESYIHTVMIEEV